ncbi:MAG: hypothetical protein HY696_03330 [Deltaproteobacteria bacterium]|nr:hypothetical protein [Deltaproteobacteria bacterium]
MGPEGWLTACKIAAAIGSIVAILGGYGSWYFGKQIDKDKTTMASDKSAEPSAPVSPVPTNQSHTGSGDNVAGNKYEYNFNKPQLPALRTIEEKYSDNADSTHNLIRTVEMNAPYAGKLVVTIKAEGLRQASVEAGPRHTTLPDGNVLTVTGGGMVQSELQTDNFYTVTIPAPSGRYIITAVTKNKTGVDIGTVFQ